jgi:hypothetical protein
MRLALRRKFEAARSALVFCQAHPDPNPVATEGVDRLREMLEEMETWSARESRCQEAIGEARRAREAIHAGIRTRLLALVQLTVLVARQERNPDLALRLPRDTRVGRVNLLAELRRALVHVRRRVALYRSYGLPDSLVDELEGELLRYQQTERQQARAETQGAEATEMLNALAEDVHFVVRHLGALNRIRFAAKPLALAAWRAAIAVAWPGAEEGQQPVVVEG